MTVFKLLQEKYLRERNKPGGNVDRGQVVWEGEVPTLAGSSTPGRTASFNGLATWPLASLTVLEGAGTSHLRARREKTTLLPPTGLCPLPRPQHTVTTSVTFAPAHSPLLKRFSAEPPSHGNSACGNGQLHFFKQNLQLQPCQQNRSRFDIRR